MSRVGAVGACVVVMAALAAGRFGCEQLPYARRNNCRVSQTTRASRMLASAAAVPPVAQGTPSIRFARTKVDFGRVGPRSVPDTATFAFENVGTGILHVTGIKKCCGTEVQLDRERLLPGETGAVKVNYSVDGGSGQLHRQLVVSTNDPLRPEIVLTIHGWVEEMLRWEPRHLYLIPDEPNGGSADIVLESLNGEAFSITGFEATDDCISLLFDPNHRATRFVLKPRVDMNSLQALDRPGREISLHLSHSECGHVSIRFDLIPPFVVAPHEIFIVNAQPGRCVTRRLEVRENHGSSPGGLVINRVTMNSGAAVLRGLETIGAVCIVQLDITPPAPEPGRRYRRDELTLGTADGKEFKIKVRILYAWGSSPEQSARWLPGRGPQAAGVGG